MQRISINIVTLFIFLVYYWTATHGTFSFGYLFESDGYNKLTDGFLAGHLHILDKPSPQLLSLPDQYSPEQNAPYRLHDASLFKGKYYYYFGPVPAIVVYLPYLLITGNHISNDLVILIYSFGTFIFNILLLMHFRKLYFKDISSSFFLSSLILLGIANGSLVLLCRHAIYEVAISSAIFFLTGAIYFCCLSISNRSIVGYFLSGLFCGMSAGSRAFYGVSSLLIFIVYWITRSSELKSPERKRRIKLAAFLIPLIFCFILLGFYNYLRFENIFEFGNNYVLAGYNPRTVHSNLLQNVPIGLYFHLFNPPKIDIEFPFLHCPTFLLPSFIKLPNFYLYETIIGVFFLVPFITIIFLLSLFYWITSKKMFSESSFKKSLFMLPEFFLVFIPGILNLFILSMYFGVSLRYTSDYANFFILVSVFILFYFENKLNKTKLYTSIFRSIIAIAIVLSIIFSFALSIKADYGGLEVRNPIEYQKLKSNFESYLGRCIKRHY